MMKDNKENKFNNNGGEINGEGIFALIVCVFITFIIVYNLYTKVNINKTNKAIQEYCLQSENDSYIVITNNGDTLCPDSITIVKNKIKN